jgi:hypothetical protein
MFAELFASRARRVSVFFADLFGVREIYNRPGIVDGSNWTLRLPWDFEELYRRRRAEGSALDLPLALALALRARGLWSADLGDGLLATASPALVDEDLRALLASA